MARRVQFAPVSSAPSMLRPLAAGYFFLSGAIVVVAVGVTLVGSVLGSATLTALRPSAIGMAVLLLSAAGWMWASVLLARGARAGGILALTFVLLPDAVALVQRQPVGGASLLWDALSLFVLAVIWKDLR